MPVVFSQQFKPNGPYSRPLVCQCLNFLDSWDGWNSTRRDCHSMSASQGHKNNIYHLDVIQAKVIWASPVSDMFDFFCTWSTIRPCYNQICVISKNCTIKLPLVSGRRSKPVATYEDGPAAEPWMVLTELAMNLDSMIPNREQWVRARKQSTSQLVIDAVR